MDAPIKTGQAPELRQHEGIATITLRRPDQLNRFTSADLRTLQDHCAQLAANNTVRVVALTADTEGQKRPVFSAGYDVGGFNENDHDPQLFEQTVDRLAALPQILIAGVNGSVYGGATDLVLACDLRLGMRGTEWRMPACALGLHYYPSGLQRYVAALGMDGAKQAFLTARALTMERLDAWGAFVALHEVVDFEQAFDALTREVAQLAPLATRATKASLNEIGRNRSVTDVLREREALCLTSADFAEGRRAFAERRPPRFTGN